MVLIAVPLWMSVPGVIVFGMGVFVHYSAIESDAFKTLKENDRVEFVAEEASERKSPNAQHVRVIDQAERGA